MKKERGVSFRRLKLRYLVSPFVWQRPGPARNETSRNEQKQP